MKERLACRVNNYFYFHFYSVVSLLIDTMPIVHTEITCGATEFARADKNGFGYFRVRVKENVIYEKKFMAF